MKKKICLSALIILISAYLFAPRSFANEIYVNNISGDEETVCEHKNGFIEPEEWGMSFGSFEDNCAGLYSVLPEKYDTRDYITIPAIRNQGIFGTCWAHAAAACMEINLIKKGLSGADINLSELQMAYFAYNSAKDPLELISDDEKFTYEDMVNIKDASTGKAIECYLCYGGNSQKVMGAVTRGIQFADENESGLQYSLAENNFHKDISTKQGVTHSNVKGLSDSQAYINPKAKVVGYCELDPEDMTRIKEAIMNYGAVQASYCHDDYYLSSNRCYAFCPFEKSTNHAITIIGWDDTVDAGKFANSTGSIPSKNGAWICRNSWGTSLNSMGGYFYLSYDDASFGFPCVYDTVLGTDNHFYFYENTGLKNPVGSYYIAPYANVYKASGNSESSEKIYAVGAWVYSSAATSLRCDVYTGLSDENDPLSGRVHKSLMLDVPLTRSRAFVYKELDEPLVVSDGEFFSIVLTTTKAAVPVLVYEAKKGQTFCLLGSTASDISEEEGTNACIYAYTEDTDYVAPTYSINYELNGGSNSSSNPSTYTFGVGVPSFAKPTKKGYEFKGWFFDKEFSSPATSIGAEKRGNVTLYAKWAAATYKITYVLNGGSNSSMNPLTYKFGEGTETLAAATRKGYDFLGWYKDESFKTPVSQIYADIAGNITLYAKWKAKTYSIAYVLNGGSNDSGNPSKYTYGVGVTAFKAPIRTGYKFLGWYKDSDFKTAISTIGKTATGKHTLYAKWQKKEPYSKTITVAKNTYKVKYSFDDKITDVIFVKTTNKSIKSLTIDTVAVNGKTVKVTQIAASALKGNTTITKLTLGSGIKKIGKTAFYGCKNLKSLVIKTTKLTDTNVGASAFKKINSSATVKVPAKKLKAYKSLLKKKGITGKKQKIVKY